MTRMMKQPVLNLDAFLGTREKKAILKMAKKNHGSDVELVYANALLGQFVCVTPDMEFGIGTNTEKLIKKLVRLRTKKDKKPRSWGETLILRKGVR